MNVYDQIEDWWWSNSIQMARNIFVNRFANRSKSWRNEWKVFAKGSL